MSWRYQRGNQIRISKKNRQHNVRILITSLYLQNVVMSALLWYTDSDYPFGIFRHYVVIEEEQTTQCAEDTEGVIKSVYRRRTDNIMSWRLSVLLRYMDSDHPVVSSRHCVVCYSSNYGFWLPLCIFKTLWCLLFFDIRILITPLVSPYIK
jgi:hypothetical protein